MFKQSLGVRVAKQVTRARQQRRHLYHGAWHFELASDQPHPSRAVLDWCREVIATCRRPFGIDYFDLAIQVREPGRGVVGRLSLVELRPLVLYAGSLEERLAALFERPGRPALHVSASIFSWGDAAHEALPATV